MTTLPTPLQKGQSKAQTLERFGSKLSRVIAAARAAHGEPAIAAPVSSAEASALEPATEHGAAVCGREASSRLERAMLALFGRAEPVPVVPRKTYTPARLEARAAYVALELERLEALREASAPWVDDLEEAERLEAWASATPTLEAWLGLEVLGAPARASHAVRVARLEEQMRELAAGAYRDPEVLIAALERLGEVSERAVYAVLRASLGLQADGSARWSFWARSQGQRGAVITALYALARWRAAELGVHPSECALLRAVSDRFDAYARCRDCGGRHVSRSSLVHWDRDGDDTLETGQLGYRNRLELAGFLQIAQRRHPVGIRRYHKPSELGPRGFPTSRVLLPWREVVLEPPAPLDPMVRLERAARRDHLHTWLVGLAQLRVAPRRELLEVRAGLRARPAPA